MDHFTAFLEKTAVIVQGLLILLMGPLNIQLGCVIIIVIGDLILGVMAAKKNETFKRDYFVAKTIEKTIVYLVWIIIGHAADVMISLPNTIRGIIVFTMFGHEFASAIKNTGELGYKSLTEGIEKRVGPFLKKDNKEGLE